METQNSVKKVSITQILVQVVLDLKKKKLALSQKLIVLVILMTVFESISGFFIFEKGFNSLVLYWILYGAVFTLFAVTCHRVIILGPYSVPRYGLYRISMREARFYGWGFITYFYMSLITLSIMLPINIFAFEAELNGNLWFFNMYIALIPGAYIFSRLSVLFPATAINYRKNMNWAWDTTRGNGWRLFVLLGVIPMAIGIMTGKFLGISTALDAAIHFIGSILTVFEIAILSHVYKYLAGEEPTSKMLTKNNIAHE
jgi:hypothetical protein